MPTTSALLRSAQSARQKVRDYEDQVAAYNWESSTKTYDQFREYSKFLQSRSATSANPSDALSYQTKIRTARRSYVSEELQREQMKIMEGRGTTETKMAAVKSLFDQAVENGDANLAQNLLSQWDSLSIKLQNEQKATQSVAKSLAKMNVTSVKDAVNQVKAYIGEIGGFLKKYGQIETQNWIKENAKELGVNKNAQFFDVYISQAEQALNIVQDAMQATSDPDALRSLQQEYNTLQSGKVFDLPGMNGATIKVSLQDLKNEVAAAKVDETTLRQVQTADGTVFDKNQKTGFVWGRDEKGNYIQVPLYNAKPDYRSQVVTNAATGERASYKQLLENADVQVVETSGGQLIIRNTGNIPGLENAPFPVGQDIAATVGANGELQITDGKQAYNFEFDDKGAFKGVKQYVPSAITQIQGTEGRFNSGFIRTLDLAKLTPDISSLVGVIDEKLMNTYMKRIQTFKDNTAQVLDRKPATILQSNVGVQASPKSAQKLQPTASPQRTAPATKLQDAVNPFNLPRMPKLSVAKPTPVPQIKSVKPIKTQSISSVGVARPTGTLRVL